MGEILISVVIPLYNGADHILKCIDHLDKQDCDFEYEVFVVDDCSTDDSASVVEDHLCELENRQRFHLIRSQKNGRAGAARNQGVKAAKGHYILFMDQDDYPDKKMLRVLWDNSGEGQVDLVSCAVLDRGGDTYFRPSLNADHVLTAEERSSVMRNYGYVFASLMKREVLLENQIVFPENVMFEDCLYNAGILACVKTVQTVEDVLYYREDDENSQTASFSEKKLNDRITATITYLESFKNNPRIMEYLPQIKQLAFYYIYTSCMLWLLAIPKLYTKALFERCIEEGKALNVSWNDVQAKKVGLSRSVLYVLKLVYYIPAMAHPVRLCGTTVYKILKAGKKNSRDKV